MASKSKRRKTEWKRIRRRSDSQSNQALQLRPSCYGGVGALSHQSRFKIKTTKRSWILYPLALLVLPSGLLRAAGRTCQFHTLGFSWVPFFAQSSVSSILKSFRQVDPRETKNAEKVHRQDRERTSEANRKDAGETLLNRKLRAAESMANIRPRWFLPPDCA